MRGQPRPQDVHVQRVVVGDEEARRRPHHALLRNARRAPAPPVPWRPPPPGAVQGSPAWLARARRLPAPRHPRCSRIFPSKARGLKGFVT